jgi:hypothetical protein
MDNDGHLVLESVRLDCGLVALGNVVSTLTEPQWQQVQVPYTHSMLTRLLKVSELKSCDMILLNSCHIALILD